jgi:1-acyl-sn-glycerol-3-phosphate acyltransferase
MQFIRSLIFWIGMFLSTLLFGTFGWLVFPLRFEQRFRVISQWANFNLWWLELTCDLRYQVDGIENIRDGASIIFCKHQSTWETLVLQRLFPPQVWLLKRELLWIPIYGWGLAVLKPIAIDRKAGRKAIKQLVNQGTDALKANRWVVIFPEGTRTPYGADTEYKIGGGILAEKSGFPVVPVAHTAGYYWPRHSFIKKPGIIRLSIGPAISSDGKKASQITQEAKDWIEGRMQEIAVKASDG